MILSIVVCNRKKKQNVKFGLQKKTVKFVWYGMIIFYVACLLLANVSFIILFPFLHFYVTKKTSKMNNNPNKNNSGVHQKFKKKKIIIR